MESHQEAKYRSVLESRIDHLETEIYYLNELLLECGFPMGIASLKETVEEVLQEKREEI